MTGLAEGSGNAGVRRSITYSNREFQRLHSPILRHGFSVVSVAIALGVAFALQNDQLDDARPADAGTRNATTVSPSPTDPPSD
jgi:hypothetical protein